MGKIKWRKFFLWNLSLVVGSFLVLFVGLFLWADIANFFAREKFDPEIWVHYTDYKETATSSVRLRMLADLLNNYDLEGKHRSKIEDLLGKFYPKHPYQYCYYLGPEGGFVSIDENLFLCFDFDENQKVVSVYQRVFR